MDLDAQPVTRDDVYLAAFNIGNEITSGYDHVLMTWEGSGMPTRAECADLVATQGTHRLTLKKGDVFCAVPDEGRTAVLTVKSMSGSRKWA
ncbi:hypothetical protein [Streptomyces nigra]|uniref:hypothetical protein n=1 Tax=Streptomyces nigra TaxID=1827580 RepID=UPI00365E1816